MEDVPILNGREHASTFGLKSEAVATCQQLANKLLEQK
jgi:hypothetical protein